MANLGGAGGGLMVGALASGSDSLGSSAGRFSGLLGNRWVTAKFWDTITGGYLALDCNHCTQVKQQFATLLVFVSKRH